jgi:hypothetical protein
MEATAIRFAEVKQRSKVEGELVLKSLYVIIFGGVKRQILLSLFITLFKEFPVTLWLLLIDQSGLCALKSPTIIL